MCKNNIQKERGVALYLTIIVMALLLGIALGVGSIFVGGSRLLRGVGHSMVTFYAADAGIERILYEDSKSASTGNNIMDCDGSGPPFCEGVVNAATYKVVVTGPGLTMSDGATCNGVAYCAESAGTSQNSSRKIQIER